MPGKRHTDQAFEKELTALRGQLLQMAGLVEHMILESVEAFGARDATRAKAIIALDHDGYTLQLERDAE